jgi:hypothetical protein
MLKLLLAILARSRSRAFLKFFCLILVTQAVTIFLAWLLLGLNVSTWTHGKALQALQISNAVAERENWSRVNSVPRDRDSGLFEKFRRVLKSMSRRYFPQNDGGVFVVIVDNGKAEFIDPDDPRPRYVADEANPYELTAYSTARAVYNDIPYSDITGTYIGSDTPIQVKGKVIGLIEAEFDSSSFTDLTAIVRRVFLLSILPSVLLSLTLAYIFAAMFVEPIDFIRTIRQLAIQSSEPVQDRLNVTNGGPTPSNFSDMAIETGAELKKLSPAEAKVAELAGSGLTRMEIASKLHVSPETDQ